MLHISTEDEANPGKKLKDILNILINNFQQAFSPGGNLSVDETMVGFRGCFAAKQYIPSKPIEYGRKAHVLADSTHGYVLNALVYTGADTLSEADPIHSVLPQPTCIVIHLLEPYKGKVTQCLLTVTIRVSL